MLVWQLQVPDASAQSILSPSTPAAAVINNTLTGAGSALRTATTSGTMSVTSKTANPYRITARLATALPTGVTLSVTSTGIGTSLGAKTLSTTAVDVINNVGRNLTSILVTNNYTLTSTIGAGVNSSSVGVVYSLVSP